MRVARTALVGFAVCLAVSCSATDDSVVQVQQAETTTTTVALAKTVLDEPARSTSTEPAPTTPTTVATECNAIDDPVEAAPSAVVQALEAAARAPGFDGVDVSISVWIDGWGEVLAVNADDALAPASNQKILVGLAVNEYLDPGAVFRTTIEAVGDDLVVRAGGDPTLTSADIDRLAQSVAAGGVSSAERLIVDVSAYAQDPRAPGWFDWQIPRYVGPLSGLMIDDNRWTTDEAFVADPAWGNGTRIREAFERAGIEIAAVVVERSPVGIVKAAHESEPIAELARQMMWSSDNQHADLLMMELGRSVIGAGTLAAGAEVIDQALTELCVDTVGSSADGSGLSRRNQRSAREFQEILRVARTTEAGQHLREQLPVGGVSGTLQSRFTGDDAGRVRAKTGTIIGGRALSGYATTDSGREVAFSIIVNGEPDLASGSLAAIDALVTAVLRS